MATLWSNEGTILDPHVKVSILKTNISGISISGVAPPTLVVYCFLNSKYTCEWRPPCRHLNAWLFELFVLDSWHWQLNQPAGHSNVQRSQPVFSLPAVVWCDFALCEHGCLSASWKLKTDLDLWLNIRRSHWYLQSWHSTTLVQDKHCKGDRCVCVCVRERERDYACVNFSYFSEVCTYWSAPCPCRLLTTLLSFYSFSPNKVLALFQQNAQTGDESFGHYSCNDRLINQLDELQKINQQLFCFWFF